MVIRLKKEVQNRLGFQLLALSFQKNQRVSNQLKYSNLFKHPVKSSLLTIDVLLLTLSSIPLLKFFNCSEKQVPGAP